MEKHFMSREIPQFPAFKMSSDSLTGDGVALEKSSEFHLARTQGGSDRRGEFSVDITLPSICGCRASLSPPSPTPAPKLVA